METMRRSDRAMSEERTWQVLDQGVFGILATCGDDGWPHAIQVNYARVDRAIYFHCALEGKKLRNLAANPKVCFTVTGNHQVLAEQFSMGFESVIAYGHTVELTETEDKVAALMHLVAKYSRGFEVPGEAYARAAVGKTRLFKIDIEHISGKERHS